MTPTYAERLRLEGAALGAFGLAGTAAILATREQAKRNPPNTIGQLVLVGAILATVGRRTIARELERSTEVAPGEEGTGEPTPLQHVPVPVLVGLPPALRAPPLTPPHLARQAGWDAAVRLFAGAALFGGFQALIAAPMVRAEERRRGVRFYRMRGSSLLGTKLGYVRA